MAKTKSKLGLAINENNARIHLCGNDGTFCGLSLHDEDSPEFVQYEFSPKKVYGGGRPSDWCSKCLGIALKKVLSGNDTWHLRAVLQYVLEEKQRKEIDAIHTEIAFDSEGVKIQTLAGKTTGVRGSMGVRVKHTVELDWERLEGLRDIVEDEGEPYVMFNYHSERGMDEV